MGAVEAELSKSMEHALANKDFKEMRRLESLRKQLNTLGDKTRYATYGNSSFFADISIGENELEEVYQLDLDLSDVVDSIEGATKTKNWQQLELELSKYDDRLAKRNLFLSNKK